MNKIRFFVLSICLALVSIACEREYLPPPLSEPKYIGDPENTTIKDLKAKYVDITAPQRIEEDLIIKGLVTGNDESGNIYKQIYIRDASAAINIGVDQNSMYASYQVGQEVYIHLKDLFMVKYGGELQIGMGSTNANRISWEMFKQKAFLHSWADADKATPQVVQLNELKPEMVNSLVEIHNVTFTNGGKNAFTTGDATTNEQAKSESGNIIDVRTSNFSTFAKDILPSGKGTLIGMLGRFNGAWQLILRTKADVKDFDGITEPQEPTEPGGPSETVFFNETFGTGEYPNGNRPKIGVFTGFDMKNPIVYADQTEWIDIRTIGTFGAANPHAWLPAGRESLLHISGINTIGKNNVSLRFQLAPGVSSTGVATANLNNIQVRINGETKVIPSQELTAAAADNNKFFTVTFSDIPQSNNLVIEFISSATANLAGFRLDNIQLFETGSGSGPIVVPGN